MSAGTHPVSILDCHVHFLDAHVNRHPLFQQRSPGFEALVGDYSALPRTYLPDHYLQDVDGFNVVKTVWAEFMSDAPISEVRWAESLTGGGAGHPSGMIALADFAGADIAEVIANWASISRVRAVRQHMAWHPTNPLLRYAPRPDLMDDAAWRQGVACLRQSGLCCEIEILAPQLSSLTALARALPDVQFILPLMGWPVDLTDIGYRSWRRDMAALSRCANVVVKIFGLECIFGLDWTARQVRPWILDTIEMFGPGRCMFASHMPIARLACSFQHLYSTYLELVADFSASEKQSLFHDTAAKVYRL